MIILIDIDSTLTNFSEVLLHELNDIYKTSYPHSAIDSYEWFDQTFEDPWSITDTTAFWNKVQVNPYAIETIHNLMDNNLIYLVTASHYNNCLGYKIKSTLAAFPDKMLSTYNVIVAQNKSMIKGDVLIDDSMDNLKNFNGVKICYAQPWNESWTEGIRTNSWTKIYEILSIIGYRVK